MFFYVITTFQHKCNLCKLSIFLGVNVLELPKYWGFRKTLMHK